MKPPSPFYLWLLAAMLVATAAAYVHRTMAHRQLSDRHAAMAAENAALVATLTTARQSADALALQVDSLDTALGEARTRLTTAEARNVELTRELVQTRSQIGESENLARELAALQAAHRTLQQELATAPPAALDPEMLAAFERVMGELGQRLASPPAAPRLSLTSTRARTALVVSVGPSQSFVVLNYGAEHGALPRQEFLIRRGTETVAKVHISDVRPHHSIAQVQPDSLSGVLHKGDSAVLSP